MKKKLFCFITVFTLLLIMATNVYAYENSIYKIEVPSNYFEMGTDSLKIFMKDSSNTIMVYSIDSKNDRDIASFSDSELEEFIKQVQQESTSKLQIIDKEKGKLGNAKAIHLSVQENSIYGDMYIMTSNKHMVMVAFFCENRENLRSDEFVKIKDSFKFKEGFFDMGKILTYAGVVIIIAAGIIRRKRRIVV